MNLETYELIEHVFKRPRLWCGEVVTLRELMMFVNGIRLGRHPPHGNCLTDFGDYVRERFKRPFNEGWHTSLLREFEGLEFVAACEAILGVLQDWKASRR